MFGAATRAMLQRHSPRWPYHHPPAVSLRTPTLRSRCRLPTLLSEPHLPGEQAYDGSWSVIPIKETPDLYRIYVPPGFAINSSGLLIKTHDAPSLKGGARASRYESTLAWWHVWCTDLREKVQPLISKDHRVGFLGALTARTWRWVILQVSACVRKALRGC